MFGRRQHFWRRPDHRGQRRPERHRAVVHWLRRRDHRGRAFCRRAPQRADPGHAALRDHFAARARRLPGRHLPMARRRTGRRRFGARLAACARVALALLRFVGDFDLAARRVGRVGRAARPLRFVHVHRGDYDAAQQPKANAVGDDFDQRALGNRRVLARTRRHRASGLCQARRDGRDRAAG